MALKKILIVDDSAAETANLKAIVTESGWLATTASSGKEAVDKARIDKPDLILMDIIMPEMDGYEACRTLQADPATKSIPVVIVSTKSQKADLMWAKMQGARTLVGKPYTKGDLVQAIQSALA
ncbi:MAG: response regulator [Rhodanobacteraceae bacterium]|nr:response regulator [Rhodanobacteraceae bacterium]